MTSTVTRRELYALFDTKTQRYFVEDKETGTLKAELKHPDYRSSPMKLPALFKKGTSVGSLQEKYDGDFRDAEVRTVQLTMEIEIPNENDR